MKLLQSLFILTVTVFFVSCGGDGGLELTLTSPGDGSTFTGGQTITIEGTATDDVEVRSIIVSSDGLIETQTLSGNGTAILPFGFTIRLEDGTPALETDIVVAILDNEGNSIEESRSITIQ
jgi:hypothetical protein